MDRRIHFLYTLLQLINLFLFLRYEFFLFFFLFCQQHMQFFLDSYQTCIILLVLLIALPCFFVLVFYINSQ